jgi:hypothetical protein
MVDVATFLTTLYVMVDDFCKTSLQSESHPGPQAALSTLSPQSQLPPSGGLRWRTGKFGELPVAQGEALASG